MTNGRPVTDSAAAPWVATLDPLGDGRLVDDAVCGGALVTPDRVVTAAHCLDGTDPSRLRIHLNARVLSAELGVVRAARSVASLPGYRILRSPLAPESDDTGSARYDLAVILLDRPVTEVPYLPVARSRPAAGTPMSFFAHGLTGKNVPPGDPDYRNDVLNRGELAVLAHRDCAAATPAIVDEASVVCARSLSAPPVTGCWRDSGSPAVVSVAGRPALAGVFSFGGETAGKACGEPAPVAFGDVASFRQWILGPLHERAPYPLSRPVVAAAGQSLRCAGPTWDRRRGQRPLDERISWAVRSYVGPYPVLTPIPDATSTVLRLTADVKGEVVCVVDARNGGGAIRTLSAATRIAG
ncbi:MAG: trypsin-like serine protease [Mycobacteriaceae bacterium]|nr:trypsin-like serine protease [Mycobacteriaceae bacterium]